MPSPCLFFIREKGEKPLYPQGHRGSDTMYKYFKDTAHAEMFLRGLAGLTGFSVDKLKSYAKENNLFNILDHPGSIQPTKKQMEKIELLKNFVKSYQVLRIQEQSSRLKFDNPADVGKYFIALLEAEKDKEIFMAAFLDTKLNLIETKIISTGMLNQALVDVRAIVKFAINSDCTSIIVAHNHPSGSTQPSREDIALTRRLYNVVSPLNIEVIDHIIVGGYNFYSMAEHGDILKEETIVYEVFREEQREL